MTSIARRVIIVAVIIAIPVAYWLVSPLFITRRVSEELPVVPTSTLTTPAAPVPTPSPTSPVGLRGTGRSPAPPLAPPLQEGEDRSPREGEKNHGPVLPPPPQVTTDLARGTFVGLAGHRAQGTARRLEFGGRNIIRFESDFRITNGPDLFVHLGREGQYDPNVRLGGLKGNEGSQNYEVPADVDAAAFDEVWVWCRAFSVPFGRAVLTPLGNPTPHS